jgi:hypothetical protein
MLDSSINQEIQPRFKSGLHRKHQSNVPLKLGPDAKANLYSDETTAVSPVVEKTMKLRQLSVKSN